MMMALVINTGCEEEEAATYEVIGESTDTITDLSVSNDEPEPGDEVIVTAYYVNIGEDPASKIDMYVTVDGGSRSLVTTLDESSASEDAEIVRTFVFTVPAALSEGTEIVMDMELHTQREFPKITRTSLVVQ